MSGSMPVIQGREPEEHPWYTGPRSLAAHHLICSEVMADDGDWARFCREFGYDINRRPNGCMLPSRMDVACALEVPAMVATTRRAGPGAQACSTFRTSLGARVHEDVATELCTASRESPSCGAS